MKNRTLFVAFLIFMSCQNVVQLSILTDIPNKLKEVSGTEVLKNSNLIWILNDGGNQPKLFAVSKKGNIKKEIYVNAKNHDWEYLSSNEKNSIYIGDFVNNLNKRKNLRILKIDKKYLDKKYAEVEKKEFKFENQHKFPLKKNALFFDAEAFCYFKKNFYVFTKSRVKNKHGKTFLNKFPAQKGKLLAKLIGEFENCTELGCWITSADISSDGKK